MTNTIETATKTNAFASTFYFFADTQSNVKKIKRACNPTHPDRAEVQCKFGQAQVRTDRRAADNSGFKKLAVQWLQEVQYSNEAFVVIDSLRLRNRQLLKPTNR
jgi:hypothetical protein